MSSGSVARLTDNLGRTAVSDLPSTYLHLYFLPTFACSTASYACCQAEFMSGTFGTSLTLGTEFVAFCEEGDTTEKSFV